MLDTRSNQITVDLNGAASLAAEVCGMDGSGTGKGILVLEDFVSEVVKFTNFNDTIIADLNDDGTATIKNLTLQLSAKNGTAIYDHTTGQWGLDVNGFLTHSALSVPEPAEWGAIFGAIALGLAIYRRRK